MPGSAKKYYKTQGLWKGYHSAISQHFHRFLVARLPAARYARNLAYDVTQRCGNALGPFLVGKWYPVFHRSLGMKPAFDRPNSLCRVATERPRPANRSCPVARGGKKAGQSKPQRMILWAGGAVTTQFAAAKHLHRQRSHRDNYDRTT